MYDGNVFAKVLIKYGFISTLRPQQVIICPFHQDGDPSLIVDLQRNKYYCFGCGTSGDVFEFVKKYRRFDSMQTLQELAKIKANKAGDHINIRQLAEKTTEINEYELNKAKDFYFGLKQDDWEQETDDKEINYIKNYLINERGFTAKILNDYGCKQTYKDDYPFMFPLVDNGKFYGYNRRAIDKKVAARAKYFYNKGFSRKHCLAGFYDNTAPVYLVEGYFDMLKLRMFGVKNVAALLGWCISPIQVQNLKTAGVTHVISALDNDDAGKKGTKHLQQFFNVERFKFLKGIKDPGEMSRREFNLCNNKTYQERINNKHGNKKRQK